MSESRGNAAPPYTLALKFGANVTNMRVRRSGVHVQAKFGQHCGILQISQKSFPLYDARVFKCYI